ncbi:MAG TPA: Cof-type HAD-IIB family hydrolase [Phototrophicaceae bacterium]|nr:Cof-type HAD-IIB family hydrolase [Phototrophicaceae bacterium]
MTQEFKPTKPVRLIAVDVDHTLLNSKHELTERTEKALRAALTQGVRIVLATGKTYTSAAALVQKLGLTTPGIYAQGTLACNADGSISHQQVVDPAILRHIITFAEDRGFSTLAYSGNRLLLRRPDPKFSDMMTSYHEPMPEVIGPLQNVVDSLPINKLVIFSHAEDAARAIKSLRWQLGMQVNGTVSLIQAGMNFMMEVLPPGAGKAAMLKLVLKDLMVLPDEVLAIGDAENDVEMIQLAGVGVAVGNAGQHVKAVANYVAPSNDEDGVAEAIERFALKKEAVAEAAPAAPETTTGS